MNNPTFWKYRALNNQNIIVENIAKCPTFPQLVLTLQQQGLQVIDATSIQPSEYNALLRLEKMKKRFQKPCPQTNEQVNEEPKEVSKTKLIHRFINHIMLLFRQS